MKRINKIIIFVLAVLILLPVIALADDQQEKKHKNVIGLRIFTGYQIPKGMIWSKRERYDWVSSEIYVSYGWILTDRWQIDIEGNVGQYRFEDFKKNTSDKVTICGIVAVASYDFLKFNDMFSLYGDLGAGVAYWDDTPNKKMINNDMVPGIILYGLGVKVKKGRLHLKCAYRFVHYSAIFDSNDSGVNTHGLILTINYEVDSLKFWK